MPTFQYLKMYLLQPVAYPEIRKAHPDKIKWGHLTNNVEVEGAREKKKVKGWGNKGEKEKELVEEMGEIGEREEEEIKGEEENRRQRKRNRRRKGNKEK